MKIKTFMTVLAGLGVATAVQANTITFNSWGSGDLGAGAKTFTSGGISLTITPSTGQDLFGKTAGGDETGLGLSGTTDNEITPTTYIALTVPTVPASTLKLVFLGSVQNGEAANIYWSKTLGDLSDKIGTVANADGSFDVSGVGAGYIMITGGGTGSGNNNVLLDSVTAITNVPDGGMTVALLGGALTLLGVARRKLIA